MRAIDIAVAKAIQPYLEKLEDLIVRSEKRVDNVNGMVMNLIDVEKGHVRIEENCSGMFKTGIEAYSREISEMRKFRDEQTRIIQSLQEELKEAQAEQKRLTASINDLLSNNQLLISNLTKLNINVKS